MKKKTGRFAAAVLTAVISIVSVSGCGSTAKKAEETLQLTKVETEKATRGKLELTSTYVGTLSPYTSVSVVPLVSGTVKTVNVDVGDKVEAGDVLCVFDSRPAELQLQSAQDAVETAKAGKRAAQDQINAGKKQADVSITSLETQKKTLKSQRDSAQKQLDSVNANLEKLLQAQNTAAQAYSEAKSVYDKTNDLFVRYQAFIISNPDCATTAGLISASIPDAVVSEASGGDKANGGNMLVFSVPDLTGSGQSGSSGGKTRTVNTEKQKTAATLLKLLGEVPTSVEYMSSSGLALLKNRVDQASALSASAQTAYTQASTSATTLEANIEQLDQQIEAMDKNIDAAEEAKDATAGTGAYDAQIKAAETGVESAQYQMDLYTITAPISGIIESVNVTANQMSAQGQQAFSISDKEIMKVTFYVPESVRDHLGVGDMVNIESTKGELKGNITSIGTSVDPQKGLFKIEADILTIPDKSLLSNTSVNLSVVSDSVDNEILIPFDAVYYDNDQAYVFVIEKGSEETKALRKNVTAGLYSDDLIAIKEGLSEGDEVITSWGAGLKDGASVEVLTH